MTVKTYRGKEMKSILSRIKEELGENAVILSTHSCAGDELEVRVGLHAERRSAPRSALSEEKSGHVSGRPEPGAVESALALHGITGELAGRIASLSRPPVGKPDTLDRRLAEGLSRTLRFEAKIPAKHNVVALIGATGVGKTTTIAKLAARVQMAFGIRIGLISADSYRVGAGFHLQSYASLLSLPFRGVDPSRPLGTELLKAIHDLSEMDLVLVDTSGCSPREQERLDDLGAALNAFDDMEKILVLPAPGNEVDLLNAARRFDRIGYNRVILSKLDESAYMGPALSAVHSIGKPLAFLTSGQRVPEDIEPASSRRLGWILTRTIH